MKLLITGATGRVGTAVTTRLAELGMDVRATDQRSRAAMPVPVDVASLLDPVVCYRLVEGVDTLIHIANHPNIGSATAQRVFGENCTMNGNILQAAMEMGVKRVIFTSTVQTIIGKADWWADDAKCELPYLPIDGQMPANPGNAYAASKVATETLLQSLCRHDGLHAVVLRLPHMRSPGDEQRMRRLRRSSKSTAWGQAEAFTYLQTTDLADLVARIVQSAWTGYQCHLPADARTHVGLPPREAYTQHLAHVPLRVPLDELTALADASALEHNFGWTQPGKDEALVPEKTEA